MAYDLILRRQTPTNYSRDSATPVDPRSMLGQLSVLALIVCLPVLPEIMRAAETSRLRREYRSDLVGRELQRTVEMPAVSMKELVYGEEKT
jgi:hypothetical protein